MPINIPWGLEFSGGPISWTQVSYLGGSTLTHYCRNNAPHLHNREEKDQGVGRKVNKHINKQTKKNGQKKKKNKTNKESNTQQTRTPEEIHILTNRRDKKEQNNKKNRNQKKELSIQ